MKTYLKDFEIEKLINLLAIETHFKKMKRIDLMILPQFNKKFLTL